MIEQLAEHGVQPSDLTPALMMNARVKNPMAGIDSSGAELKSPSNDLKSPMSGMKSPMSTSSRASPELKANDEDDDVPPPYEFHEHDEITGVRNPDMLPSTQKI